MNPMDMALDAVDNTARAQDLLGIIIPLVAAIAIVWIAMKSSVILAALIAGVAIFVLNGIAGGVENYGALPVPQLIFGDILLVATAFFIPEREAKPIYRQ
jgi:uncharacterized membrane protein YkgB